MFYRHHPPSYTFPHTEYFFQSARTLFPKNSAPFALSQGEEYMSCPSTLTSLLTYLDIPLDIAKLRCQEDIAMQECFIIFLHFVSEIEAHFWLQNQTLSWEVSIPAYREIFMSIYSVLLPNLLGTSKNPKAANKMQRPKSPPLLVFYWGSIS